MLKKFIPKFLRNFFRSFYVIYRAQNVGRQHREIIRSLRNKKTIKVAFMVIYESMWKYEKLYFILKQDRRFDPVVFICPFHSYGQSVMQLELNRTYESFSKRGYKTVKTLRNDGTWLNIKKDFNPDIVFFTNPWRHTNPQYLVPHFWDRLTCYVPYGFESSNLHRLFFKKDMYKLCWKIFAASEYHKKKAERYGYKKARNFVVTGYPGVDSLISSEYSSSLDAWKPQEKYKKRIIWAPHHSVIGGERKILNQSTFLQYADLMLEIALEYQDEIQMCFKPHPNLRGTLNDDKLWGNLKLIDIIRDGNPCQTVN